MNISGRHNFSADAIGAVTVCQFGTSGFRPFPSRTGRSCCGGSTRLAIRELSQARDHMVLLGRRSADEERSAAFVLGWRQRLSALEGSLDTVPLPMSRAGHRRLSRPDHRNRRPRLHQAGRHGAIEILHGGISLRDAARVRPWPRLDLLRAAAPPAQAGLAVARNSASPQMHRRLPRMRIGLTAAFSTAIGLKLRLLVSG